ncbi:Ribosomal large subunit pseudouridine synthase [Seminavis robusta]|uniref:Ribosomal large subunit pseudouridine synthase n=1 Tax=Seminavis robusta TaxID=568900 RepID=A0A9N8HAB9_9STRA|nr:Ribosomal large subunit pseudouridine synthase [Seminavis robusta]|eukprot:Sro218_g090150.1 Ribosomal large subunit pseudouridine synthase (598) ;mRNA; f:62885-64678
MDTGTDTSGHADADPLFTEISPTDYSGELPDRLAYPHWYQPHPVAVFAANELRAELQDPTSHWSKHDFGLNTNTTNASSDKNAVGKMFGVLVVVVDDDNESEHGKLGYLKAFSGTLQNTDDGTPPGFCPMIYDRFDIESFYKQGEEALNAMNRQVEELEQSPERRERKKQAAALQQQAQQQLEEARQHGKSQKRARQRQRQKLKKTCTPQQYQAHEEQLLQDGAKIQLSEKALKTMWKAELEQAQQSLQEIEDRIQDLKQRRKNTSAQLQNQLFDRYQFLNRHGDTQSVLDIFAKTPLLRPPGGAGDCAAPKLFQYAYKKGYRPIALAEFWWGKSPALEIRKHNFYYPACRGKCQPILEHMLQGCHVEDNPLEQPSHNTNEKDLEILYEDDVMLVVNKPPEMLSVPGRLVHESVYSIIQQRYPNATGPLLVHRLDMSTSGILVIAKDKDTHKKIQSQFIDRSIKKRYTALLEGELLVDDNDNDNTRKGKIDLPLSLDYLNRPMHKVDYNKKTGKPAVTFYEVLDVQDGRTRIHFYPVTGRTHQLRVHAAHALGLNMPIVGDDIYGQRDERMCLHAGFLEMTHPTTEKRMTLEAKVPF